MKNHKKYLSILVLGLLISCISVFGVQMPSVYAEDVGKGDGGGDGGHHYDTDIYPYSLSFSATQNDTSRPDSNVRITESEFVSSYPIFLYRLDDYADDYFPQSYRVGIYDSETDSVLAVTNSISKNYKSGMLNLKYIQSNYAKKDNEIGNLLSQHDYSGNDYLNESSYFQIYSLGDFTTDAIVFRSQEAALSYYRDGDRGGIFQEPAPDYDYAHDFRSDVYDSDIPVPELSNLSHNGFHVNNADPSRDIEIYMVSNFYGLKHKYVETDTSLLSPDSAFYYEYDNSWVIGSHRFNLINTDISYSDADIDIKEMFKVDNVGALINDFKNWSEKYPTHTKLPDYSFFKYSSTLYSTNYSRTHVYESSIGNGDEGKLKLSGQASTTYYVRFCQYVAGSGYTYGKWVSYTFSPRGFGAKDNVVIGDVSSDSLTGDPYVSNPVTGTQDPDTGDVIYTPDSNVSSFDASELWLFLESLVDEIGVIPELISKVLSFLPNWIIGMIIAGLAAIVILRFVGR